MSLPTSSPSPSEFVGVVAYLADLTGSLRSFLTVYPPACHSLVMAGFVGRVVGFYERVVTRLQEQWHHLKPALTE